MCERLHGCFVNELATMLFITAFLLYADIKPFLLVIFCWVMFSSQLPRISALL